MPELRTTSVLAVALSTMASAQQFAADPLQGSTQMPNATEIVTGRIDGDAFPDLVITSSSSPCIVYRNDGHGRFFSADQFGSAADRGSVLALGDLDGDGDHDVVVGASFRPNRVYLNNSGIFTEAVGRLPNRSRGTQALALFDADGDGDLDLVVGDQNERNSLFLNNGTGILTDVSASRMPSTSGNTHALVPVDVDGDLDLDLIVGNDRTGNRLLLNNGTGTFTVAPSNQFPSQGDATFGAAAADLNGDNRPDIVLANGLGPNRLLLNVGGGRFVDATTNFPSNNSSANFAVALGDVDGDGDVDAVFGTSFGQDLLWLNNGAGRFGDATNRLPQVQDATSAVVLMDADHDDDLDLFLGKRPAAVMLSNFDRHLTASGMPRGNTTWTLRFSRQPGYAATHRIVVALFSPGARTPAVRFPGIGNLLLNPGLAISIPGIPVPSSTGSASLPIAIPPLSVQSLVSVQAVLADLTAGRATLTNALSVTFAP